MNLRLNFGALKKLKRRLEDAAGSDEYVIEIVSECGEIMLDRVAARTPVDTGNLRECWEIETMGKRGFNHFVELGNHAKSENGVEYLEYVEYGHKQEVGRYVPELGKRLVKPWVEGQHFVEKTKMEMEEDLPDIIEDLYRKKIEEILQ